MQKKFKVVIAGIAATALLGGGTAIALVGTGSSSQSLTPTTTEAPKTEVLGETIEQEAESATPTTTAPAPPAIASDVIKAKQQKLLDAGYWMPAPDGKLGANTIQAVLAFQKLSGLPRTGKLDDATMSAIDKVVRPTASNTGGNVIEIDKKHQVILFTRDGQVQWVFNTSTGTERSYVTNGSKGFAHTPTGTFAVNRAVNGVDPGPLGDLYRPRYFTNNGIAIHGAASIPASPASHGCARVSNAAMDFIWNNNMMPMGATVWVYDDPKAQPITKSVTPTPTTTTTAPQAPPTTPAPATTTTTVPPTTTTTVVASTTTTTP